MRSDYAVKIGNPRGLIALYLDEQDALDLAAHFGPSDLAYDELTEAVERAYPHEPQMPEALADVWMSHREKVVEKAMAQAMCGTPPAMCGTPPRPAPPTVISV